MGNSLWKMCPVTHLPAKGDSQVHVGKREGEEIDRSYSCENKLKQDVLNAKIEKKDYELKEELQEERVIFHKY